MSEEATNMRFWNELGTTDPSATKKVTHGRKYTSVNTVYVLKRMTELFGPVGQGWGWEGKSQTVVVSPTLVLAVCETSVWYRIGGEIHRYGPTSDSTELVTHAKSNGQPQYDEQNNPIVRTDEDAFKKASTGALKKALSHLGMAADVFEGLFDDDRYVQQVGAEYERSKKVMHRAKTAIAGRKTTEELDELEEQFEDQYAKEETITFDELTQLKDAIRERRHRLESAAKKGA